jgi:hypothetical protein
MGADSSVLRAAKIMSNILSVLALRSLFMSLSSERLYMC